MLVIPHRPGPAVLPAVLLPRPLPVLPGARPSLHHPGHLSRVQVSTERNSPASSWFLPSCDDDYFCGWNCRKCSEPEFCSSCGCTSSLGCARNCAKCGGDFSQPAGESSLLLSVSKYINKSQLFISRFSARVCGLLWSCRGLSLHLPFHLRGSQIRGLCSSQRVGLSDLFDPQQLNRHCRGLSNLYSSLYWCSTKVDINGFHIRGPYDNRGVCT